MARVGKVKIEWISDQKKRKNTEKRRLLGLQKTARELAVCVPLCLVVYCHEVVWSSSEVSVVFSQRYKELTGSMHVLDNTGFLWKMVDKMKEELLTDHRKNAVREVGNLINYLHGIHRRIIRLLISGHSSFDGP